MLMWLMNMGFAGGQAIVFPSVPLGKAFDARAERFHFDAPPGTVTFLKDPGKVTFTADEFEEC